MAAGSFVPSLNLYHLPKTLNMKKLIASLIFFSTVSFSLSSTANAQAIWLGTKVGLNLATLNGQDVGGPVILPSANAGMLVQFALSDRFSLQPEVQYSLQGADQHTVGGGQQFTLHLDYVNIPVLVKYILPIGLFFETGPQLGLLVSAKDDYQGGSVNVKDELKSTDFSWLFGAGYTFFSGLGVDARFNPGLINLLKNSTAGVSARNTVLQIDLFYMIRLSR